MKKNGLKIIFLFVMIMLLSFSVVNAVPQITGTTGDEHGPNTSIWRETTAKQHYNPCICGKCSNKYNLGTHKASGSAIFQKISGLDKHAKACVTCGKLVVDKKTCTKVNFEDKYTYGKKCNACGYIYEQHDKLTRNINMETSIAVNVNGTASVSYSYTGSYCAPTVSVADSSIISFSKNDVNGGGMVTITGLKAGKTSFKVSFPGGGKYLDYTRTCEVNVTEKKEEKKDRTITFNPPSMMNVGNEHAEVYEYTGDNVTSSVYVSDSNILSVTYGLNTNGGHMTLKAKKAGTAKITINIPESDKYKRATEVYTIEVKGCEVHPSYSSDLHECTVCGEKYNDGKTTDGISYDTHVYGVNNLCKICGKLPETTLNEFVSKLTSWGGYKPNDEGNVTFTGGVLRYTIDGVFDSGVAAIATYSHYTPHTQNWHDAAREELGYAAYVDHLGIKGQIGGGGTITGVVNGNTITFSGFPTSGGPYRVFMKIGVISSGGYYRYTTPGASVSQDDYGYIVTTRHIDELTGEDIIDPEKNSVSSGGKITKTKKEFDEYSYVKVVDPDGKESSAESLKLEDIKSNKEIKFYYTKNPVVTVKHINSATNQLLPGYSASNITVSYNGSLELNRISDINLKACGQNYIYDNKIEVINSKETETINNQDKKELTNIVEDIEVIFYYSQYGTIKVVGRVNSDPFPLIYAKDPEKIEKLKDSGETKKYTPDEIPGFKYVGYKVEIKEISDLENMSPEKTGSQASVTITPENPYIIITFLYEVNSGIKYSLKHWDNSKSAIMASSTSVVNKDLGFLLTQYVDLPNNEAALEEYSNAMSSSNANNVKAAKIFEIINKYWNSNSLNIKDVKSLNLESNLYKNEGYTNDDFKVQGNTINKTATENSTNTKEIEKNVSYTPSFASIAELLKNTTLSGDTVEMIFYYSKAKLEVHHIYLTPEGNIEKQEQETKPLGEDVIEKSKNINNKDYVNKEVELDGAKINVFPPENLKEQYEVKVEANGKDRVIKFYYIKQPEPIEPDDPIVDPDPELESAYEPVTCDPELKVNGVSKDKIMLDSKFTIEISNKGVHKNLGSEEKYYNYTFAEEKMVKFDCDVYYKESDSTVKLIEAGQWIRVANRNKIVSEAENVGVYEFGIPAWVEEKEYNVEVRVGSESPASEANMRNQSNDILNGGQIAYNELKFKVVGKIYDFSVTNLESDEMWKNNLFKPAVTSKTPNPNDLEHEADTLPIGQAGIVPDAYKYGLKLGSSFLFSVNTLGLKNNKVQIIPKVYFVDINGGTAVETAVETGDALQYRTNQGMVKFVENTAVKLTTKINKTTRMTAEVKNEVSKSILMRKAEIAMQETYGQDTNLNREYGHFNKLIIKNDLRLPYAKYIEERKTANVLMPEDPTNENKILSAASHWYAEYKLPATTTYTNKNGFYIVCFKITSLDESGNQYLVYENQEILGNQWKNEKGDTNGVVEIKLPKVIGQTNNNARTNINIDTNGGYYPVAIYQANLSINNDYEIAGTH